MPSQFNRSLAREILFDRDTWYRACGEAAERLRMCIPSYYRSRTFSGILGDIKALPPAKALSLISRKKGLGKQYAWLYLTQGVDGGHGYQACAADALRRVLHRAGYSVPERILDVGCAVGITGGAFGIDNVTGFDLFTDILDAAKLVDSITGARNTYLTADMTKPWPLRQAFDMAVGGLVCHHLKEQCSIATFFSEANRVLKPGGVLAVTFPAGSIATASLFDSVTAGISSFGFEIDRDSTGIVVSTDTPHSVFWMFLITARKEGIPSGSISSGLHSVFTACEHPSTREEKGARARVTASGSRKVKHDSFIFAPIDTLLEAAPETVLVFDAVATLYGDKSPLGNNALL